MTATDATMQPPAVFALDQVLARAADPQAFERWFEQVASTGFCSHPIRLQGTAREVDLETGEVRTTFDTSEEPDGTLLIACGNRRASVCPSCAATYRADAWQLIAAGLRGGKGVPDSVATHPALFVTFTAPSFGPVHAARDRSGKPLPCRPRRRSEVCPHGVPLACWERHGPEDEQVGRPLCVSCFDYEGLVLFNALAPELWRRTTIYLRRALARRLGLTQKACRKVVRVSYTKVAEYQARGAVHFHAVIRLDAAPPRGEPGRTDPPPSFATAEVLEAAIRDAVADVKVDTPDGRGGTVTLRWGEQLDIQPITLDDPAAATSPSNVAAYVAKYATKSTEAFGLPHHRIQGRRDIDAVATSEHVRQILLAAWRLGERRDLAHLKLRRWVHCFGFGGHWSTKSRRYSTTFKALRQARRDYARARRHGGTALDAWGRPVGHRATQPAGSWRFCGTGHRTNGDAWLAASAAARAREQRRIAKHEVYGMTASSGGA